MKKWIFCLCCVYSWAGQGDETPATSAKPLPSSSAVAEESHNTAFSPLEYCQHFALQYVQNLSISLIPHSLSLSKGFPPDDPMLAEYICQFKVINGGGAFKDIFVTLFLVEDYDLAVMIKEERWAIIPVTYIREAGDEEFLAKLKGWVSKDQPEGAKNSEPVVEGYGIFMSNAKSPPLVPAKEPSDLQRGRTPTEYCHSFAQAYGEKVGALIQNDTLTLLEEGLLDKMEKWSTNFFQPPGDKFIQGYKCQFEIKYKNIAPQAEAKNQISIDIFLVEKYSFAKYTTMENWQIIPIEYLKDPVNEEEGYAVFKFLDRK